MGLWLEDMYLPAEFRVKKDKTVEYLKKEIKGLSIVKLEVDEGLPICRFYLKSKTKDKILHWLYGDDGGGFILQDKEKEKSFSSFMGKISNDVLDEVREEYCGQKKWKREKEGNGLEEYFSSLKKMVSTKALVKKKVTKVKRKISHIETDLERLKESQKHKEQLVRDEMSLDDDFNVKGLKVKFKKESGHYQRRDMVLTKLKDWAKASDIQEGRLDESRKVLDDLSTGKLVGDVSNIKVVKVNWSKNKSSMGAIEVKGTVSGGGYDLYELEDGTKIGIGKNASGNDELRKSWGKKDDYWFHIEGEKGSHLILKGDLKPDYFNLIGSILRDYSNYSGTEIPVIYSTVGKIKGMSGKRGAVTISKPRYFQSIYMDNWREIIANGVF